MRPKLGVSGIPPYPILNDLVVGADGANSKIRELLFGPDCKPRYTGQAVWR